MPQLDMNAILLAAVLGGAGFILSEMRRPGRQAQAQQQQIMWMGLAAAGAYFLRQFEGRGNQQETQSVILAALESRFEERFKTVFNDISDIKEAINRLAEVATHKRGARR